MRELKSDIIHALQFCDGVTTEKLVEISNICDKFQSRLDIAEANLQAHNSRSQKCTCWRCLGFEKDPYAE
jgi:hypothetical protein